MSAFAASASPNFSYTHLGLGFGDLSYGDVEDESADEDSYSLSGATLHAGYIWSNVYIQGDIGSYSESGDSEDIEVSLTLSESRAWIGRAFPIGPIFDFAPFVGVIERSAELCFGALCYEVSNDSGMAGAQLRMWVVPGSTEILARGYTSDFGDTVEAGISQKISGPNHRISFEAISSEHWKRYLIYYSYRWL